MFWHILILNIRTSSPISIPRLSEDDVISTTREGTKEPLQQPSGQRTSAVDALILTPRKQAVPFVPDQQSSPSSSTEGVASVSVIRRFKSACNLCDPSTQKLRWRLASHCDAADARSFACRICSRTFKGALYLSKGIRTYHQKPPQTGQFVRVLHD